MMAMLQWCLMVFVLVGCQLHTTESAVTFPTDPVVVSISKKPAVNSAVVTVTATDDTDGTTLAYTLESQNPDTSTKVFSIDGTSAAITVSDVSDLNYPNVKEYSLVIKAAQSGNSAESDTTTVTVSLVNKEPKFAKALYTVCVNKGLSGGIVVLQVTASDEDGDTLEYLIADGNTNSIFAVEASNGTINVASGKAVDETPTSYNLTLKADDNDATTPKTGTTTVSINVADPCPGDTPPPSFATTITASFCLFLVSGAVHLMLIW